MDLNSYKGTNRLLIVFSSSAGDALYERQERLLKGPEREAGFEDRDLVGIRVFMEGGDVGGSPVSPGEAAGVRERYGVGEEEFAALLVGKDGTEKFRSGEPVSAEEVFDRIDAMPMRRREMEQNG